MSHVAYRERIRLDHPVETVRVALDERFRTVGDDRWATRRWGGLYHHEVALDAATGTATVSARVPSALRNAAVAAPIALAVALAAGADRWVTVGLGTVCAALALCFVGHLLRRPDRAVLSHGRAGGLRLSGYAALPHAGVLGVLAAEAASSTTVVDDALTVTIVVAAVGTHYAGNTLRTGPAPVRTLAIPVSALLPGVIVTTNLFALGESAVGGAGSVAVSLVVVIGLNALFFAYCRVVHDRLGRTRLRPTRSRLVGTAATVVYGTANAVLIVAVLAGAQLLLAGVDPGSDPATLPSAPSYVALDAALAPLPGPSRAYSVAAVGSALVPVLAVVRGWATHLAGIALVRRVVAAGESVESPVDGVAVRVVEIGAPVVRPTHPLGGPPTVAIDRSVYGALAADELAAVVTHEAYHLRNRSREEGLAATLASIGLGGRNVLLSFVDFRAAEAAADEFAADAVGRDALCRAIRRIETLRSSHAVGRVRGLENFESTTSTPDRAVRIARRALDGPRQLFFGSVLLDGAHRAADERVRRLCPPADAQGCTDPPTDAAAARARHGRARPRTRKTRQRTGGSSTPPGTDEH